MFVSYIGGRNLIDSQSVTFHLLAVLLIIIVASLGSLKRQAIGTDFAFMTRDTSETLRGVAIILLLFGHFLLKCVAGLSFVDDAGQWGVVVFLYISAVALMKSYPFSSVGLYFIWSRLGKILLPAWVSVGIFSVIGYMLLGDIPGGVKILFMVFGIFTPSPPNGPVWFITYILFLYTIYTIAAFLKISVKSKIVFILFINIFISILILSSGTLISSFGIWVYYSYVFPFALLVGLYRDSICTCCSNLYYKSRCIYFWILFVALICFFVWPYLGLSESLSIYSPFSHLVSAFAPVLLTIFLVLVTWLLDNFPYSSKFLIFLGRYSFGIYILHFPIMVYYDFLLFREPLFLYFLLYLFVVCGVAIIFDKCMSFTRIHLDKCVKSLLADYV